MSQTPSRFPADAASSSSARLQSKRWLYFLLWTLASAAVFWKPILTLIRLTLQDENVSHIILIPFIAAWLFYQDRDNIRAAPQLDVSVALFPVLPALGLIIALSFSPPSGESLRLTAGMFTLVLLILSGFILFFGHQTLRACWFPFAFLLFAVPLPRFMLDKLIYALQAGSAEVAAFFFNLSGYPVLREGFVFRLPRISIEVAQECSGIRSSVALIILAILVAHFSFRPFWKKAVFICAGLLMMIIKNGIRIATLSLLGNYVDPDFLYGKLHHRGGVVFFLIGLGLLVPVYWLLRRGELTRAPAQSPATSETGATG